MARTSFDRLVAALEGCGLYVGVADCPVKDADDLLRRVEIAARNRAAGRRKAAQEAWDQEEDVNPAALAHDARTAGGSRPMYDE